MVAICPVSYMFNYYDFASSLKIWQGCPPLHSCTIANFLLQLRPHSCTPNGNVAFTCIMSAWAPTLLINFPTKHQVANYNNKLPAKNNLHVLFLNEHLL